MFNFNPDQSFTNYGIRVEPGKYNIVLNTDAECYGGFNRIDETMEYHTSPPAHVEKTHWLRLYLPSRTAFVIRKAEGKRLY